MSDSEKLDLFISVATVILVISWIFLMVHIDHFTDSVRRIANKYSGKEDEE